MLSSRRQAARLAYRGGGGAAAMPRGEPEPPARLRGAAAPSWHRGLPGALLVTVTALYLLLVIGPLGSLFLYVPFASVVEPDTLKTIERTLGLTLKSSLIATGISVVLGLPTALCLARLPFRGKRVLDALVELPIALPPLVIGVALLLALGRRGFVGQWFTDMGSPLSFTFAAVIIAQFAVSSPFFVRIAKTAIEQVPQTLEEASLTLGVGPLATYMRVTLPLAKGGIFTAALTCWARAMSEFGATMMFAGNFPGRTQTVPLAIFSTMQYDIDTSVALSIIMLSFSACAFVIAQICVRGEFRPAV